MTATRKIKVSDLLCGLGGATEGCHQSDHCEVVEGLNHSPHAIMINEANHPKVKFHIVNLYDHDDLKPCDVVIAGIECTNHSNAKGGMSREADSRAMANEMFRYSRITGCSMMVLENVREFLDWGPLIKKKCKKGVILKIKKGPNKGKPIWIPDPKKKGRHFITWKYKMQHLYGFENFSMRIINAADYGVATTRKRLFMIFSKNDWKIEWPEPTHFKTPNNLFNQEQWIPCSKFIDLDNHGKSIFGRKRKDGSPNPLVDNTLARIAYGIKKYALNNNQFILKYYGNGKNTSGIDKPLHTITTKDRHAIVTTDQFYIQHYHNSNSAGGVNEPMKTIVTKDEKAFITIEKLQFIDKYFGGENNVSDVNAPLGTITTAKQPSLTSVDLIFSEFNRVSAIKPLEDPISTITTFNKRKVRVELIQFISKHFGGNHASSIDNPLSTITTIDHNTLVSLHIGKGLFLLDIKMRWLTPRELASCQGFPEDYILLGSKREQIKGIGNSICPPLITAIMNSIGEANKEKLEKPK